MKKVTLLFTAFLCLGMLLGVSAHAQNHIELNAAKSAQECTNVNRDGFHAHFSFSDLQAVEVSTEKGVFSDLMMDGTIPAGNVGDPSLPAVHQLLAIPFGAKNVSVNVTSYSTTEYSLNDFDIHRVMPMQASVRKDQKPEDIKFAFNENAYNTRGFSERPLTHFEILGNLRGIQVGSLTINPINYDPTTNTIRVVNDIELDVNYNDYDKVAAEEEFVRTASIYFKGIYSTMFNWRDDVYDQHPDLWAAPVRALVIANRMFEECMQEWISWKTTKGFYLDVNYTDDIGNSASAIRSFIQQKYAESAPSFIIIFGDKNQVPGSYTGTASQCITDLQYMSVDNDDFPDMLHSRLTAETVEQMQTILYKDLMYERYEFPDPTYLSNVLLIAGWDGTWNPRIGKPTIQYATYYYYNAEHGFNNVYEFLQTPYNQPYASLNTGVGFVNYTAHGSNTSWSDPSFTVSNVNSLTNEGKPFLAMGNCCQAADWGISGTCLGEAMIRNNTRGAYAYIGSCPSSYWYEDYYFGVGATNTMNTMPTYENSSRGTYDGVWMDDVYNTVSSIPFLGNLAVCYAHAGGYQGSVSDHYYWESYHALGDGSIMPWRVMPTENNVSHLPTVPIGVDFYNVTADPGSYAAISKDGVLYGAGLIGSEGSADIAIEPITSGGDVTICVTHPQRQPYITIVPAAALDGAYITYNDYEAIHPVVTGGWVPLNVSIKNVGTQPGSNLTVTLNTSSPYISLINNETQVANIDPDQVYTIADAFDFDVAVNVPDKEKIQFFLNMTDGTDTWESKFTMVAAAPAPEIGTILCSALTPGETGTIEIELTNGGSFDAANGQFELVSCSNDLTIENPVVTIENLAAGETQTLTFNIQVAESVENGSTYELSYHYNCGHYGTEGITTVSVGQIMDGFETGDFTAFNWTTSGSAGWTIVTDQVHSGTYSARSGNITHSQSTELILNLEVLAAGQMSYFRKVSSEANYDKFHFYIDNQEMEVISGDQDWTQASFNVTAGTHTFHWTYTKDSSVDNGSDCAWIDDITFPPTNVITGIQSVSSLEATVEGLDVNLTWRGYAMAANYIIYRDGVEIGNSTTNTYTDNVPEDGVYTYGVAAQDAEGNISFPIYITVSVGTVSVAESHTEVAVYPNPVKDELNIRVNGNGQYALYNGMGQQVASGRISAQEPVKVNGLSTGLYFLRVDTGAEIHFQKIVVE